MPTLNLPVAGGKLAPYTTKPPRNFPAAKPAVQPHRLCRRACGRRSAGRRRTLARRRDRLGRAPSRSAGTCGRSGSASPRRWTPRSAAWAWTGRHSLELIRRSLDAAKDFPGALIGSGAGTDHLEPGADVTIDDVIRAYEEQCAAVEKLGGRIVLMASRALVKAARSPDDYAKVYGRILDQVKEPVIIHWLGEMFDPALDGLLGSQGPLQGDGGRHRRASPTIPPRSTA